MIAREDPDPATNGGTPVHLSGERPNDASEWIHGAGQSLTSLETVCVTRCKLIQMEASPRIRTGDGRICSPMRSQSATRPSQLP